MPRTITRNEPSLFLDEGGVEFADLRASKPRSSIVFKVGTTAGTGLHWHEDRTEYLQIEQGHALVTIGDETAVFGPDDGVIKIPRFVVHQYSRADAVDEGAASRLVELRLTEWTDPNDGDKAIFFRNVISCIKDKEDGLWGGMKLLLSLFVVMYHHDNYPVLYPGPTFLGRRVQLAAQRLVTHGVLKAAAGLGFLAGMKGSYSEYTP